MISAYANQALTWAQAGTPNQYNEPTWTTSTIKGRKETGYKQVRNAQGEVVVSSAVVFTGTAVAVGDKIDGAYVLAVKTGVDLQGTSQFYEAYLA